VSSLFGAKTLNFSKFMVRSHGQVGRGSIFRNFVLDVLYGRDLRQNFVIFADTQVFKF